MTARNLKNYIFMAHTCFKRTKMLQRVPLLGSPLREFVSGGSTIGVSFKGSSLLQRVPLLGSPLREFASEDSTIFRRFHYRGLL